MALDNKAAATGAAQELAQQARFIGGKTFFQNGAHWIDSEVQKRSEVKRVRVQFGSTEYFALLNKNREVAKWAAQGTSVQFVLADTIYEIHE
jgi:hypothetical protein